MEKSREKVGEGRDNAGHGLRKGGKKMEEAVAPGCSFGLGGG